VTSRESRMLLKTIGSRPSRAGCLRILLTGLLTTAVDDNGCNWTPATNATPTSRPVRQQRTGLDGQDLATDQQVGQLWAGLQFGLQFTGVQSHPGRTGGRWSSLNRSERSRPELLMRLEFAPFRGSDPRACAAHRPSPWSAGGEGLAR
jgi:hypothetical protein